MPKMPRVEDLQIAEREMKHLLEKDPGISPTYVLATVIDEYLLELSEKQTNLLIDKFTAGEQAKIG